MDSCSYQGSSAGSASYEAGYCSDDGRAPKFARREYKDAIADLLAFGATMFNQGRQQQDSQDRPSPSLVSLNSVTYGLSFVLGRIFEKFQVPGDMCAPT